MASEAALNGAVVNGAAVNGAAMNGHSEHRDEPGAKCRDALPGKQKAAAGRDAAAMHPVGAVSRDAAAMHPGGSPLEAAGRDAAAVHSSGTAGSIAGVYVEAMKKTMSFYDATREHLLSLEPALLLLEAQAATGGIADVGQKSHVSVAEAVQRGLVGLELKERLLAAERAAVGFKDPYTEEQIPLFQALQKELLGREQGLRLLEAQLATGGLIDLATGRRLRAEAACEKGLLDEETGQLLSDGSEESKGFLDPNSMERVSYAELRGRCVVDPASGLLLLPLQLTFAGLGGRVSGTELQDAGIISPDTLRALQEGKVSAGEVAEDDAVQRFLRGTRSVAGVVLPSGERRSLYQALQEHLLLPGAALALLQVQASTGSLIDPIQNRSFSVDEAVRSGLVGPELHEKLSSAERSISGYRDPRTGEMLSLFQAVSKGFVPRDHGLHLLEAQMATGGVIAPGRHLRVPAETACRWGYLDESTLQLLANPTEESKGFFHPGSQEKLSYAELLAQCVTDPSTGLLLLPLGDGSQGTRLFLDRGAQTALENTKVPVAVGKFKGKSVSLWKLLFSDYIQSEQRAALTRQHLEGALSMREMAEAVRAAVEEMASAANITFEGLRGRVTADQLLSSEIINRDLFKKLKEGETSAKEVVGMDTVRKYLEGTGSIAGLLLPESQEKISIYQAKRKGLLRPGTSLILLEAQAATGFVIDPAANKRYSVDEALRANVIGPDVYDKLLSAEKCVTGYRDPCSGDKISLFQAMQKELIVREHGVRLLEAQIATGGIIDPVHSHRIPVEVAYKRGYLDKKMTVILSDPSDDTKGFFDPNTEENLTYLQLKEKCVTEPGSGLCLLPLNSKRRQFVDAATRELFCSSWMPVRFGRLRGERVSVWELLTSEYFSEGRRREIFNHYRLKKLSLEQIRAMLEEEMKKWAPIKFPALRGSVSAYHLMETGIIDRTLLEEVLEGSVSPEEVLRMDSVRKYLYGSGSIGGIVLQPSNQRMSIYEAMKQNIVVPGVALPLLEAQAATGFIIDPVNNQKLRVDEAVKEGVIGPEVHEKLQQAEGAVSGYKDPFTGRKIPLFQAMKKGLIADKQAMQLMEVQMATGGIIDPACGHHVPIEAAQKRGCLDEDTSRALSEPSDSNRAFCVPDSKENVSYAELIQRCQKDEESGFHLLPLLQTAAPAYTDEQIQRLFQETVVKEKGVSLWALIHSGYFTEEQRRSFVERFRAKEMSLQQLIALVLGLVGEMEMKARTHIVLGGLQGSVPAVRLLEAGILTEKMFEELAQGIRTPEEVAEVSGVKRYLQGTGSIAGVILEESKQKMSFYDAVKNNLLLPGVALKLLEAQAATGYLTDPATGHRLSVRDAVRAGVVGEELTETLLRAERAVVGYTDPYTGSPISLCQAVRKELVPMADALPLLEAQLAAGGVIDPIHHHHLPLQAAYRYGFFDEDLKRSLAQLNDSTQVFFDPNAKENVTYQQLKDRCVYEAETGLWLLPLSKNAMFCVDEQTVEVLKSVTVCVNVGRFKGQTVSVWDLLNSEYITDGKRRELVQKYKDENAEALREIVTTVTTIIAETEAQGRKFAFKGLRKKVSAGDLFRSQLIDKKTLDELNQGKKTVQEVTKMDSVRIYLEGSNFIAGVIIQPSNEKMSIYQAMRKGILRPGTALVLLEAQAATGFIIDPEKNKKFSVEEALEAGLVGVEVYEKLLSAERAVTGYVDPYTKAPMSLFEAMNQGLIVKSHGVRLLEAQIATGGIIDPVHSHRIPVEVAYRRGYFNEEMNRVLSNPSDDTKGFFDPNTHENLTYMQLLERCVQDAETGLYMLQVVQEGGKYFYVDELTRQVLQSKPLQVKVGRFKDQTVSVWDILYSHYISEQKRKELLKQYKGKTLTLEDLTALILKVIEDTEQKGEALKVKGLRGEVSVSELFSSEIIDKGTLEQLQDGSLTLDSLTKRDAVRRYLDGTGSIAGVLLPSRKERMSIYQAMERGLLSEQCALGLLEAQAATGFIIDPVKNQKVSVDEAVSCGLVGSELHEKLLSAERAMTGYTDPQVGAKISLFQAMRSKVAAKEHGIRLLEAQMATGGIVDPVHSHRLPVEVAYRRGHLDGDTFLLLSDPDHGSKGFIDPNIREKSSYSQLLKRCTRDTDTGLYLLPLLEKEEDYFYIDERTKKALMATRVEVSVGKYKGSELSLWELLCSEYITEEKRKELVQKYKEESHHIVQRIIDVILNIIREKEQHRSDVWFQGIRQQITASELLSAQIITEETMRKLKEGKETAEEIAKKEDVRRYLEGTGSIAGVLVPSKADPAKTEKMSIYQAMWKGILRPGTALVLLEAQAATGFIIDPVKNQKLSVDEAVSCGLVGSELHEKLLSAERAVTGYTDPYSGAQISLFQAMQKGLIVREHGIRLLEAQIATGGIIDPVHSHRLPVQAAFQRGYFDHEMSRVLSDPSDDTKGFFDPNTHENLTYMQLLRRCVPDPDTGLYFLKIFANQGPGPERGSVCSTARILNLQTYTEVHRELPALGAAAALPSHSGRLYFGWVGGTGQGPRVSPRGGEAEDLNGEPASAARPAREAVGGGGTQPGGEQRLRIGVQQTNAVLHGSRTVAQRQKMSGAFQNNKPSNTAMNPTASRRTEMRGDGSNFIAGVFIQAKNKKLSIYEAMIRGLLTPGTALVLLEAQAASGLLTDPVSNAKLSVKEALSAGLIGRDFYEKLLSAEGAVTGYTEPYTGHKISLFQAMQKEFIVKEHAIRLLEAQIATGGIIDPSNGDRLPVEAAHQRGYFDHEMCQFLLNPKNQTRSCFDPNTHENLTYTQLLRRCVPDPDTGLLMLHVMDKGSVLFQLNKDARKALQAARTTVSVGLFQGSSSVTVWELLFSRYVSDHQREELLRKYKAGTVTVPEMIIILTAIIAGVETGNGDLGSSTATADGEIGESQPAQDARSQEQQLRKSLKSATIHVAAGELQGQNVSLLDLLFSTYIPQEKRQELLELYRAGILSTEQVAAAVSTVINGTEAANIRPTANAGNPQKAEENGDGCSARDNALKSTTIDVPAGEFSVWDLLFSDCIPEDKRQELLELAISSAVTHSKERHLAALPQQTVDLLQSEGSYITFGQFQEQRVSVWELLSTKQVSEYKREACLDIYGTGGLTVNKITITTTVVTGTQGKKRQHQGL
ncbi:epiplakin [Lagopus leucura]|uniref:epiplakin n=1 Tax=Lagopus leucura TaxID=30410 RepID=UPI001C67566C|nr:epiplakin [Lagopus leucura]